MSFETLGLSSPLLRALSDLGYTQPTEIQQQAIPLVLEGRDVLAGAQTGTGKTAAFALPLLQRLAGGQPAQGKRPRALVLTPTRELAAQVQESIRDYGKQLRIRSTTVFGGVGMSPQIDALRRGVDILVATPGRLIDHMGQGTIDLSHIEVLVLDEADRMLDMGFEKSIKDIVRRLPKARQSLLFSATWPEEIRALAKDSLREPVEVSIEGDAHAPDIDARFYEVALDAKPAALMGLLLQLKPESAVVFCNTRRDVDEIATALANAGFSAAALHGDMEQRDRDEVLVMFANRSLGVLVASDVAARGLDVKDLACVVNYELPHEADVYLHRSGRTARAGGSGLVLNLVTSREMPRAQAIEAGRGEPIRWNRPPLNARPADVPKPAMRTLRIDAGRTDKLRPGDILGALTGAAGLKADAIGKIDVFPTRSYVAVRADVLKAAIAGLQAGKIKGRSFRVRAM